MTFRRLEHPLSRRFALSTGRTTLMQSWAQQMLIAGWLGDPQQKHVMLNMLFGDCRLRRMVVSSIQGAIRVLNS